MMEDLINQQWRSYVLNHITADTLAEEIDGIDWSVEGSWSWCAEMALDAGGVPRVMVDHGICSDEAIPESDEGGVLIACPITEDTTKQDLIDFDAAAESEWESEWPPADEDEDDEENEGDEDEE